MKLSNQIQLYYENKSLDKQVDATNNGILSQKHIAVTPNCSNWLFYCLNGDNPHAGITSYIDFVFTKCLSFMVWLILQNKPIGEYVERFLYVPRVRPHRPMTGYLLKNHIGVFA